MISRTSEQITFCYEHPFLTDAFEQFCTTPPTPDSCNLFLNPVQTLDCGEE